MTEAEQILYYQACTSFLARRTRISLPLCLTGLIRRSILRPVVLLIKCAAHLHSFSIISHSHTSYIEAPGVSNHYILLDLRVQRLFHSSEAQVFSPFLLRKALAAAVKHAASLVRSFCSTLSLVSLASCQIALEVLYCLFTESLCWTLVFPLGVFTSALSHMHVEAPCILWVVRVHSRYSVVAAFPLTSAV